MTVGFIGGFLSVPVVMTSDKISSGEIFYEGTVGIPVMTIILSSLVWSGFLLTMTFGWTVGSIYRVVNPKTPNRETISPE